jgi:hypothetical protein
MAMGITGSGVGVFVGVGNGIGVTACPGGNGYLAGNRAVGDLMEIKGKW